MAKTGLFSDGLPLRLGTKLFLSRTPSATSKSWGQDLGAQSRPLFWEVVQESRVSNPHEG